ncbi:MAG: alpha/beta fold hydrolase [Myxococcota bacterium]|nr:alpha/beta fold hydrolase [Myxococcota bacterium]
MKLHFEKFGSGYPLVILHGLFGSGQNWRRVAKSEPLKDFTVYTLDLRNHGSSPHAAVGSLSEMATDVLDTLEELEDKQFLLLGHSLGGKVAMQIAFQSPQSLGGLVVVDIAPRSYPPGHLGILDALQGLNLVGATSRGDLDSQLAHAIKEPSLRQFLLKNITRADDGTFQWKLGLAHIADAYPEMIDFHAPKTTSDVPALFVRGGNSNYVLDADFGLIRSVFGQAEFADIADAGHWVHYEQPQAFLDKIGEFAQTTCLPR